MQNGSIGPGVGFGYAYELKNRLMLVVDGFLVFGFVGQVGATGLGFQRRFLPAARGRF